MEENFEQVSDCLHSDPTLRALSETEHYNEELVERYTYAVYKVMKNHGLNSEAALLVEYRLTDCLDELVEHKPELVAPIAALKYIDKTIQRMKTLMGLIDGAIDYFEETCEFRKLLFGFGTDVLSDGVKEKYQEFIEEFTD